MPRSVSLPLGLPTYLPPLLSLQVMNQICNVVGMGRTRRNSILSQPFNQKVVFSVVAEVGWGRGGGGGEELDPTKITKGASLS